MAACPAGGRIVSARSDLAAAAARLNRARLHLIDCETLGVGIDDARIALRVATAEHSRAERAAVAVMA